MRPPALWWSPSVGLVTHRDGVYWRYEQSLTSLRHDGLPNELPADAVRLTSAALIDECAVCHATGVKLYRLGGRFSPNEKLRCTTCAVEATVAAPNEWNDQIGTYVPAVRTDTGEFHGLTTVPRDKLERWRALPRVRREEP